jgi:hypothetical protein
MSHLPQSPCRGQADRDEGDKEENSVQVVASVFAYQLARAPRVKRVSVSAPGRVRGRRIRLPNNLPPVYVLL